MTLHPDLVAYSCKLKKSWLLELLVPFEPVAEDTKARKHLRYKDLVQDAKSSYHTELLQLIIGSRGFIFSEMKRSLAECASRSNETCTSFLTTSFRQLSEVPIAAGLTEKTSSSSVCLV